MLIDFGLTFELLHWLYPLILARTKQLVIHFTDCALQGCASPRTISTLDTFFTTGPSLPTCSTCRHLLQRCSNLTFWNFRESLARLYPMVRLQGVQTKRINLTSRAGTYQTRLTIYVDTSIFGYFNKGLCGVQLTKQPHSFGLEHVLQQITEPL